MGYLQTSMMTTGFSCIKGYFVLFLFLLIHFTVQKVIHTKRDKKLKVFRQCKLLRLFKGVKRQQSTRKGNVTHTSNDKEENTKKTALFLLRVTFVYASFWSTCFRGVVGTIFDIAALFSNGVRQTKLFLMVQCVKRAVCLFVSIWKRRVTSLRNQIMQ